MSSHVSVTGNSCLEEAIAAVKETSHMFCASFGGATGRSLLARAAARVLQAAQVTTVERHIEEIGMPPVFDATACRVGGVVVPINIYRSVSVHSRTLRNVHMQL